MSIVDPKLNESIMKICTCLKILNCLTPSMCDNESFPLQDDNVINFLQFIKQMPSFLEIHVYFQEKNDNFFLSARFLDADVYVVLCLLCIRDSVIIVEEPAESASKYRVKLCRTAVFVLIVEKRMLIIIYNHNEIKTYMQCLKSSQ